MEFRTNPLGSIWFMAGYCNLSTFEKYNYIYNIHKCTNKYGQLDRQAQRCFCHRRYMGGDGNIPNTAIYASKSNGAVTAIVVKLDRRDTQIMNCYLDRNENVVQPWLTQAKDYATLHGYALLLGMDSKCQYEFYSNKTNNKSKAMETLIGIRNYK